MEDISSENPLTERRSVMIRIPIDLYLWYRTVAFFQNEPQSHLMIRALEDFRKQSPLSRTNNE